MKNQALFSLKDKSKNLKCRLLQFLFDSLRVKYHVLRVQRSHDFQIWKSCDEPSTIRLKKKQKQKNRNKKSKLVALSVCFVGKNLGPSVTAEQFINRKK